VKKYRILSLFLILLLLAGCVSTATPEQTVDGFFSAIKKTDVISASKYIEGEKLSTDDLEWGDFDLEDLLETKAIVSLLTEKMEWEILGTEAVDDKTSHVKTRITAIDMKPVMSDFMVNAVKYALENALKQPSEEETEAEMKRLLTESLSGDDLATVTNEVELVVVKTEQGWKIKADESLLNAMLGGIADALADIGSSLGSLQF